MKQTIYQWSYKEILGFSIFEEIIFGGVPWLLPAPIRLTEIISRLIWSNAHISNDDFRAYFRLKKSVFFINLFIINITAIVYAILWSYWFTIPIPIVSHSVWNMMVFFRLHRRLRIHYLKDFFEQVDPI